MIELQVISKILTSDNPFEVDELCEFDPSYYSVFRPYIDFILKHRDKYGKVPDPATFFDFVSKSNNNSGTGQFELVEVNEPLDYLKHGLIENKKNIILIEAFNKINTLGTFEAGDAWRYLEKKFDEVASLDPTQYLDLVHDSIDRSNQVLSYSKQKRIPTGFDEVDKAMYGGFSTVEELVILVARTNTGKSWVGTKMMETAQKNGFSVLYYSPEMQASFLGTRFDTWRKNFENSRLHRGDYNAQYYDYLKDLAKEEASAYVIEDKDAPGGEVTVTFLKGLVKKLGIKELIIDGLSYMTDDRGKKGDPDHIRYKNICSDLFRLSKQCGCAVIVMMQANRETNQNKDQKGDPFPNIYNIEGSDHPARIATQVFALRQVFDKHILDIRLEKSRNASNQKPCFSYAWDINTGNMRYMPDSAADGASETVTPIISPSFAGNPQMQAIAQQNQPDNTADDDDDIVVF